eukprot:6491128-Amphidinium_carterae.1
MFGTIVGFGNPQNLLDKEPQGAQMDQGLAQVVQDQPEGIETLVLGCSKCRHHPKAATIQRDVRSAKIQTSRAHVGPDPLALLESKKSLDNILALGDKIFTPSSFLINTDK